MLIALYFLSTVDKLDKMVDFQNFFLPFLYRISQNQNLEKELNAFSLINIQNTALHLACQSGYPNAIRSLLDLGAELKYNKDSLSFIDLAIKHKQQGSLIAIINHERWEEALKLKSKEYKTPFVGIIQLSSEVTQAILERCVTKQYMDETSDKKYLVTFKFLN